MKVRFESLLTYLKKVFRPKHLSLFDTNNNDRVELAKTLHDESFSFDGISRSEIDIIHNTLLKGNKKAGDIMVARPEIIAVDFNLKVDDLKEIIKNKRHTRYPVYKENIDNIIGYVNAKDLLIAIIAGKEITIRNIMRDILIVPPSITIIKLLSKMRQTKNHIAIIIDEFASVTGLITMEDIVEEIVGNIEDEFDEEKKEKFEIINKNTIKTSARMQISHLEQIFKIQIHQDSDDFDTIGGAILSVTKHIPNNGEVVTYQPGVEFKIIDSDSRKIKKVMVTVKDKNINVK